MSKRIAVLLIIALLLCALTVTVGEEPALGPAALTLRALGFEIDYDMLAEIAAEYDWSIEEVNSMDVTDLLLGMGLGHYNWDTYEWMPISHQVYAFDAEVFDIEGMYTLFLQGIQSIVPDIEISEIKEDLSGLDENLDGTRSVSFLCNGHFYETELESLGDWFNEDFLYFMDDVLKEENAPLQLFEYYADGQFCLVIYNTEDFARMLQSYIRPFWEF